MKRLIPLALLLLAACTSTTPSSPSTPEPINNTTETKPSAPTPTADATLTLSATIEAIPSHTHRIVAPIDGRIEGLTAEVGDNINASHTIATITGRTTAELSVYTHQVQSELILAQQDQRLKQSLYADGLISERELTEATERLHLAQTAQAQLASLPDGTITSTVRGTVVSRYVTNGQYVQAGDLLLEVADITTLWAVGNAYESDLHRLHLGQTATITTLAYPDEHHQATIDRLASALDPESKTLKIRLTLPNPDHHLLPGMLATITIDND